LNLKGYEVFQVDTLHASLLSPIETATLPPDETGIVDGEHKRNILFRAFRRLLSEKGRVPGFGGQIRNSRREMGSAKE
jgi:hypothetical protein